MTQSQLRAKAVSQAAAWLGCRESDGSHQKIIDIYNSHRPLARGYALKYTDAWCAGFVSAVGIACGLTDIMPTEVSCPRMIDLYKALGRWEERDDFLPQPGDLVMYDWYDSGWGDNTGEPEHVGIIESVSGNAITVIEGNYQNAVMRRSITVNGRYIRGYCLPDYAAKADEKEAETASPPVPVTKEQTGLPQLSYGSAGAAVKAMQLLLIGYGFSCGQWGADGEFGPATDSAVRAFQSARGLVSDGICGPLTWAALLGV